ncbi:hypothetical protein CDL12_15582 [Handroanthus impetiginosus]|uniref:Uncharacterized protein n=1 Tax=Handroanthus impetiginosus TaxID=429701 RepID=A0A2G9GGP7_9LAMI|nr:hypothetical protein CDL12_23280 [Handroanthus impetiginosus]PIN11815.1 hypothetical protein CDL12_15582 [Handroanthus impetiginosus]
MYRASTLPSSVMILLFSRVHALIKKFICVHLVTYDVWKSLPIYDSDVVDSPFYSNYPLYYIDISLSLMVCISFLNWMPLLTLLFLLFDYV